jgi:lipopolysaccharide/colanic/teichoic acid biosynthesis glycosyltransferase
MTVLAIPLFDLTRSSRVIKRSMDMLGAALGILVFSPIFLLLAVAIRLDSRGSVFFGQTLVGRSGRRFQIITFRIQLDGPTS